MENIFRLGIRSLDDLKEIILPEEKEIELLIHLERYAPSFIEALKKAAALLKKNDKEVRVILQAEMIDFTDEELAIFKEIEVALSQAGIELFFDGGYSERYRLIEVIQAHKLLNQFTNFVRNSDLSPLEKYLLIYQKATKTGADFTATDDPSKTRDLLSVIINNKAVCAGFSNLLAYYCNQVGILCLPQNIEFIENRENLKEKPPEDGSIDYGEGIVGICHANNLVYLEDPKYQVKGLYYADPTFDREEETCSASFAFALLPLTKAKQILNFVNDNDLCYFYEGDGFYPCLALNYDHFVACGENQGDVGGDFTPLLTLFKKGDAYLKYAEDVSSYLFDDEGVEEAIAELKRLFAKYNIEDDVYKDYSIHYPAGCQFQVLFSLCLIKRIDEAERLVAKLKAFIESGEVLPLYEGGGSNIESIQEEFIFIKEGLASHDDSHCLFWIYKIHLSLLLTLLEIEEERTKGNLYPLGQEIDSAKMEEALSNVYEFLGMEASSSKEEAKKYIANANKIIETLEKRSKNLPKPN